MEAALFHSLQPDSIRFGGYVDFVDSLLLRQRLTTFRSEKMLIDQGDANCNSGIVLAYWNTRCLAEPIRLLLHFCGKTDFEDRRYQVGPPSSL